jgi:hypothetical protein
MRARPPAVVAAATLSAGIGIGVLWSMAADDQDGQRPSRTGGGNTVGSTVTTQPASSASTGPSTTLSAADSLVYRACAEPYRATQFGIELEAAMIHESRDEEAARIGASLAEASRLAADAARLDPEFAPFASAESYWRDHARVEAGALIDPDPEMDAALDIVSDVCAQVGVPDGDEFIEIPYEELGADTAERGRFDACEDMIFGDDGAVYVEGDRFTYDDCDRATAPALVEANHDDAYRAAVSLFLDETGGFVCWGDECRDESDFSP